MTKMPDGYETRRLPQTLAGIELRAGTPTDADGDEGKTIVGYGAVFGVVSQNLGGYVEMIDAGAFTRTLQTADVMGLFNHDPSLVLGRTSAGTMVLSVDEVGLRYAISQPDTSNGRDVGELIVRRDITGSSFSFSVPADGDEWGFTDQGFPLRTILACRLFDVGPVTYPAYLSTADGDSAVALRSLSRLSGLDVGELAILAKANDLRSAIQHGTDLPPDPPPAESQGPRAATELRRLELRRREMLRPG